jgi:benzoyl-CoA reductase subunit D
MLTAGIDLGSQTVKAVVFDAADRKIMAKDIKVITDNNTWETVFKSALDSASLSQSDIDCIISTGVGGKQIKIADRYLSDIICGAKGAVFYNPSVRRIVDLGAEKCVAMSCDETGRVEDFTLNDKCASVTGMFLDTAAGILEVELDEMGKLSLQAQKEVKMDLACAVFAESEIISQTHKGETVSDILKTVHIAISKRTASLLERLGIVEDIMVIGGVGQNIGVINELKAQLGVDVSVPEDPRFVTALGAAISGAEKKEKKEDKEVSHDNSRC